MNIGYFFWGHLTDKLGDISKNTPDGNAWYSSSIIYELNKRKHNVFGMSINRDKEDITEFGLKKCFNAFEQKKRISAYKSIDWVSWNDKYNSCNFPKLDILLIEWRFPIIGRNTEDNYNNNNWQPDLRMQNVLIDYYSKQNTKIIIFDLDYKITEEDEKLLLAKTKNILILETAIKTKKTLIERISIQIPFWMKSSKIKKCKKINISKNLVYIGSNYEREDSINKYIIPFSEKYPFTVLFYGNWRNYKEVTERIYCTLKWRDIQYHNRVGHIDFYNIYSDALCCPLLAKEEYYKNGFMTARIQECLYFGAIPIGVNSHEGIKKYLPKELIIQDSEDLEQIINKLKKLTKNERENYRKKLWKHLAFMDVSYFVDTLLK